MPFLPPHLFDWVDAMPPWPKDVPEIIGPLAEPPKTTYTVLKRVDAFKDYVADIEASSPQEAYAIAQENWRTGKGDITWQDTGFVTFDDAVFEVQNEDSEVLWDKDSR